jgi:hypothetical protein
MQDMLCQVISADNLLLNKNLETILLTPSADSKVVLALSFSLTILTLKLELAMKDHISLLTNVIYKERLNFFHLCI